MQVVESPAELAEAVRSLPRVKVTGGSTKPAASRGANVSVAKLSGVLSYDPAEFTFTALAGTRVDEVEAILARENQYLPFDPPLAAAGATLGGTVAAGLSGAGRFRFGGVRDFLLGAKLVTGDGRLVATGSRVVKNSAGFDFPKLMVGGLGGYGLMTELTFKVFPRPQRYATVVYEFDEVADAVQLMTELAKSQLDLACLDLDADNRVWARVGGFASSVPRRCERLLAAAPISGRVLEEDDEAAHWADCREFAWLPDGHDLLKIALAPNRVEEFSSLIGESPHRFSVGGNLAWVGWPSGTDTSRLQEVALKMGCRGMFITGTHDDLFIGPPWNNAFSERVRGAIDPDGKFAFGSHLR